MVREAIAGHNFNVRLRNRLMEQLGASGHLLPEPEYLAYSSRVNQAGTKVRRRIQTTWESSGFNGNWLGLAKELNLSLRVFPRLLGYGYLQTASMASIVCLTEAECEMAAWLGALFNFCVALFDHVCDKCAPLKPHLFAQVQPTRVHAMPLPA